MSGGFGHVTFAAGAVEIRWLTKIDPTSGDTLSLDLRGSGQDHDDIRRLEGEDL